jgi:chemotaxis protein MotB
MGLSIGKNSRALPLLIAGLLASALATGCVSQSKYDKDTADLKAMMAADKKASEEAMAAEQKKCGDEKSALSASCKEAAEKAAQDLATAKRDLDACVAAGGDKGKALQQCVRERGELSDRLARVQDSINKVRNALQSMAAAGKLEVKVQRGFLIIALAGDILFDTGKAKLKDDATPVLRELAAVLKAMPDRLFQVAGHTDDQGEEEKNWGLSTERAVTVVRFLIKEGVSGKTLSAGGYALYQPAADNATPEGRQKNRRVEFLLMPNLSELLTMGK